jgi:hypothetical protein
LTQQRSAGCHHYQQKKQHDLCMHDSSPYLLRTGYVGIGPGTAAPQPWQHHRSATFAYAFRTPKISLSQMNRTAKTE